MEKILKISEVEIFPVRPNNGLIAFASFVLNSQFKISDVSIHTRLQGGFRLVFPSKKLYDGRQVFSFCPITSEAQKVIESAVIGKYEKIFLRAKILERARGRR